MRDYIGEAWEDIKPHVEDEIRSNEMDLNGATELQVRMVYWMREVDEIEVSSIPGTHTVYVQKLIMNDDGYIILNGQAVHVIRDFSADYKGWKVA